MKWKHKLNIAVAISTLLIVLLIFRDSPYLWLWIAFVFSNFLLVLVFGIVFLRFQYFYPTIFRNTGKEVILTFDDGPDPVLSIKVLDILKKYDIKAIFFIIGQKALENPAIFQRIIAEGHAVGNHTQNHSIFFAALHSKKVAEEIDLFDASISPLLGEKITIFRPPIGYTNPKIARALKKRNMKIIAWSVRSYDSFKSKQGLLDRLVKYTRPSSIVLLHDNLVQTAEILEEYIKRATANGIIFAKQDHLKKFIHEINK
ncbi:polysaccharide deacetylase family protein [Fluviicola taffensis]|uniref:Polysaccharide deacetylase n=1 Tax=Fluviicola taffensis (strain DSM 16823 / NCIMB 13979 / RW262) TaxID=755732 RepID=F2IEB2_FLUTR|nr:polysaccharide deacetylase family protein [Fluviicola taffensis]AEA43436.1 polysaccharide deacetylase [Fluviicola taffensis DSM 16823]